MSNRIRRAMTRKAIAALPEDERPEPREQEFRIHEGDENGGYDYLHPTKGWKRMSGRRLAARAKMRKLIDPSARETQEAHSAIATAMASMGAGA